MDLLNIIPTSGEYNENQLRNKVTNYACNGRNGVYNNLQTLNARFKNNNGARVLRRIDEIALTKCDNVN